MNNPEALVVTNQYKEQIKKWGSILKLGENICAVFPYLSDRQSRIHQWHQEIDSKIFEAIEIDFSINHFDDLEIFENYILSLLPAKRKNKDLDTTLQNSKKKVLLIITNGESLIIPHNHKLLSFLQKLLTSHSGKVLSFVAFESNIYLTIPLIYNYNKLFQNIIYYPLYKDDDINLFIQYLCTKWKMKMASPIRKSIVSASGGSIWLAKEACRNFRDLKIWDINHQGFKGRIDLLSKMFSNKEMEILNSLPNIKQYKNLDEYKYLKNTGFITDKNQSRNKILTDNISLTFKSSNLLELKNNEVLLKGVSINQIFSPKELSVLVLFLSKPNTPLTRDEIAIAIWPKNTETHFSSWAIDQLVKRLRDRLVSLKLSHTLITSVRGVGYEYRN